MNFLFFLLCYSIANTFDKKEVAADHRVSAAHKRGSTKEVAVHRRDEPAQSASAKEVAPNPTGGAALKSPAKEIAPPRSAKAAQRSSSSKKVANYRNGGAAQKRGSARINSSTKKVANYRRSGDAQRSSDKDVGSKQKVHGPILNVSKTPILKTKKASQRPRDPKIATLSPKGTKTMLKRPHFTRKELEQFDRDASKKPVRFKMATRLGRLGNKEIVRPESTPMPLNLSKNIRRYSWEPTRADSRIISLDLMTQIMYSTQGNCLERVERVASKYRSDTRYRMAFLILTLNTMASEMHRRQNFVEYEINVKWKWGGTWWRTLKKYYNVYKMLGFYTDMLRRNIDVTYGIEYVLRLYAETALEREFAAEAKYARITEKKDSKIAAAAAAKKG